MKIINKLINYGLCLFVFLLPWQTRWIFKDATIKGGVWEYGRYSLYGTEILLIILLILGVIRWLMHYRRLNNQQRSEEVKNELKGVKLWIILFSILAALSILWATDKGLSWYYWIKLIEGVGLFWLITSYKLQATIISHRRRVYSSSFGHLPILHSKHFWLQVAGFAAD